MSTAEHTEAIQKDMAALALLLAGMFEPAKFYQHPPFRVGDRLWG